MSTENITSENGSTKKRRKIVLWASLGIIVIFILLLIFFFQKPVNVTFNTRGGSQIAVMSVDEDGHIDASKVVTTRRGWEFGGWYTNEALTSKIDNLADYTFTSSTTIYAKWYLHRYKITYNLDGGTNNPNNPQEYVIKHAKPEDETWEKDFDTTTKVPLPDEAIMLGKVEIYAPTKDGYEFDGWYDNPNFTGNNYTSLDTSNPDDITLYAKWK